MQMFFSAVVVVALLSALVQARFGVDLSVATDENAWSCLLGQDISFAKVRAYRSSGKIDTNSAASLQNAQKAGFKDLDAYIFPCITTSPYSLANNITCDSPTQQLLETVQYLAQNQVYFHHRLEGVYLSRMWLDVEDENPSKYYDPNPTVNQLFFQEMTMAAEKMKLPMGIYTTKTYWSQIMNNTDVYSTKNSDGSYVYPLWYPRYDGVNSMDFFEPFAGWESVQIKQTGGDVGYCGISQVDSNYMEE